MPSNRFGAALSRTESENVENGRSVPAAAWLCIINELEGRAGVVQWQYRSFPSFGRGFDSHRPLHQTAKFRLIRLRLLAKGLRASGDHRSLCAPECRVRRIKAHCKTQLDRPWRSLPICSPAVRTSGFLRLPWRDQRHGSFGCEQQERERLLQIQLHRSIRVAGIADRDVLADVQRKITAARG
jgi:hypothetical protein